MMWCWTVSRHEDHVHDHLIIVNFTLESGGRFYKLLFVEKA
jgi:hypothetical protein